MAGSALDRLSTLDHLISEAEARRVEQMLHIATLLAEDKNAAEAENDLRQIHGLLKRLRVQRGIELSQASQ